MNKALHGDCLELMKDIPDGSIDTVITDPPYKLNKTTGSSTSSAKSKSWQGMLKAGDKNANIENNILFKDWLPEVFRVMKTGHFYCFVNDKNINDLINESEKVGFKLHNILIWKKNNSTPNRWYMKNCEFIVFFRKGKSIPINNLGSSQFLDYKNINGKDKIHPTQKPIELILNLILNSSIENNIILDPFSGSGTTAIACINTNRKYICIEKDKTYFDLGVKRIKNHEPQLTLI